MKETLVIPRHRRGANFKMTFEEIGWEDMNSIHLAEDVDN